jgi:hypothetical protein
VQTGPDRAGSRAARAGIPSDRDGGTSPASSVGVRLHDTPRFDRSEDTGWGRAEEDRADQEVSEVHTGLSSVVQEDAGGDGFGGLFGDGDEDVFDDGIDPFAALDAALGELEQQYREAARELAMPSGDTLEVGLTEARLYEMFSQHFIGTDRPSQAPRRKESPGLTVLTQDRSALAQVHRTRMLSQMDMEVRRFGDRYGLYAMATRGR